MSDFSSHLHWVTKKKIEERGFFSGINGCVVEVWWMLHVQTAKLVRACLMQIWKGEKMSGRKTIVFEQ